VEPQWEVARHGHGGGSRYGALFFMRFVLTDTAQRGALT
jgi:hypothetical protein